MYPTTETLNNNELTIRQSTDGFSYVFVPAAVYQDKQKEKYLDFLGIKAENSVVRADYIELADVYNVYCVQKTEKEEFRHPASVLLEALIKENLERTDDARVYLNVLNQHFEMFVLKGAQFLFNNTFRFKTKEDFLYFLLFSMEQLHLDAETTPVYFMGMIEKDSKIVELVTRYVRDIRFKTDIKCEL